MPHWELLEDVFFLVNSYRMFARNHPSMLKNYNDWGEEASFTRVFD